MNKNPVLYITDVTTPHSDFSSTDYKTLLYTLVGTEKTFRLDQELLNMIFRVS